MEEELKEYLRDLKEDNDTVSKRLNTGECTQYTNTALTHQYNTRLNIIKRLEQILR